MNLAEQMLYRAAEPWLRRQAENLEDWAQADTDPGLAAETLLASVPREFRKFVTLEQLREWVARVDWWQQLVQFYAPILPAHAWCVKVHDELLEMIDEELEENAAAGRSSAPADESVNGSTPGSSAPV